MIDIKDIEEQLEEARLGMTPGIDVLLLKAKAEIKRLREENNDAHSIIRACVETEDRLRAENEQLRAALQLSQSQNYCTLCGAILDGEKR